MYLNVKYLNIADTSAARLYQVKQKNTLEQRCCRQNLTVIKHFDQLISDAVWVSLTTGELTNLTTPRSLVNISGHLCAPFNEAKCETWRYTTGRGPHWPILSI